MDLLSWFKHSAPPELISPQEREDLEVLSRADECFKVQDFKNTERLASEVVANAPNEYPREIRVGDCVYIRAWDAEDYEISRKLLLEAEPNVKIECLADVYPYAFWLLGYVAYERKDYDGAIEFFDKGLALERDNANLLWEKSQALMQKKGLEKEIPEALRLCLQILSHPERLTPKSTAQAFRGAGYCCIELDDLDTAVGFYKRSQEFDPENATARDELEYIATIRENVPKLGVSSFWFRTEYESYQSVLTMQGQQSNWNADSEAFARKLGALTEEEIVLARTNLRCAIVNRIKVRLAVSRFFETHASELGIEPEDAYKCSIILYKDGGWENYGELGKKLTRIWNKVPDVPAPDA